MSDSICNFIPIQNNTGALRVVYFVYETEFTTLKQPFLQPVYTLHLVTQGNAVLKRYDQSFELHKGSLFLFSPGVPYEIEGGEDFQYAYISFTGSSVNTLLENLQIETDTPVYESHEQLIDFWLTSISRITETNAAILTESVLLHTLSFLCAAPRDAGTAQNSKNQFSTMVDYIENHFQNPDMSLKLLSTVFSYTEKYISQQFKKNMNTNFKTYLNTLRICHAQALIKKNVTSVSHLAYLCGYSDPLYFSKVFHRMTLCSPTEFMKK